MSERVHCPECGTTVRKDTIEAAVNTAEHHDAKVHDGERTAKVNGILVPSDEVVEAAEEALETVRTHNEDFDAQN